MEQMRQALAQGIPVEISGYLLGSALANGLESTELALPSSPSRVEWLEVSGKPDATLDDAQRAAQKQLAESAAAVYCKPAAKT